MPANDDAERFAIGTYYLDRPHPERGGFWYACRYDAGARKVRRRSLGVTDFEAAKIKLATLVAAAPNITDQQEGAPAPGRVLTVAVLKAYLDDRATKIASEEVAIRAVQLITAYLADLDQVEASVGFWTPAQQLELARWLHTEHEHSPGYIERLFNVMRSAFIDATVVKMRTDALGKPVEAALIAAAPKIVMTRETVAKELRIPPRNARRPAISIQQMAQVLDALQTEHLFRFAILSLTTWARPQAVIDFDPATQAHWNDGTIDLAPVGWVPTKKRRPRQPMSLCLAGWISRWTQEDAGRRAAEAQVDTAEGRKPRDEGLLVYKRARVGSVKQAIRRIGRAVGIPGFTQKSFRYFMTDQVKRQFRGIHREQRSLWLGHVVRDGSRTTDAYESDDPHALADVALAVDCVISLVAEHCQRPLFAIETLLNRRELEAIGARAMPKRLDGRGKGGGRDRDRTCDPYHVKVVLFR